MSGNFFFEQSQAVDGETTRILVLTDISIGSFIGEGTGDGINITEAEGILVMTSAGLAGSLSFKVAVGFGAFEAGARVLLEINTTGQAINASGAFGTITLDAGSYTRLVASLNIAFPGVTISGDFGYSEADDGSQVIIGNNVEIFVGDNGQGFQMIGGQAVLIEEEGGLRAGFITGSVSLVGFSDLSMSGNLTLRINQLTQAVSKSFTMAGDQIEINFTDDEIAVGEIAVDEFAGDGLAVVGFD